MRLTIGIIGGLVVIAGVLLLVNTSKNAFGWGVIVVGAGAALLGAFSNQPRGRA